MNDVREVFEMVTKQVEPDQDSWRKQQEQQRRSARNRKIAAIVVAAAIVGVLSVLVLFNVTGGAPRVPAEGSPPPPLRTDPPLGATMIGIDGGVRERIPGLPLDARGLELSPLGNRMAFITDDRVATIGMDGTDLRFLTGKLDNSGGDAQEAVAWSPNGEQIAYVAHDDIYVMDVDGTRVRQLTDDPAGDYFPVWSSRDVIAYWNGSTTGEDGGPPDSEIYTIDATGGTPTRLTDDDVSNIEPAWSPDGTQIAYWNGGELWMMAVDGSHAHRVYRSGGSVWAPAWSPDGSKIAFITCCASGYGGVSRYPVLAVRILDLETNRVQRLDARVETDLNGPQWVTSDTLLINRFD